jgi:hypothetical protein
MSGSVVCDFAAHDNGVAVGWRAIYGIGFNWMGSARHAGRHHGKGHTG